MSGVPASPERPDVNAAARRALIEEEVATIRENVAHIARGCRSGLSHNPAVYELDINQAVQRILSGIEATEAERAKLEAEVKRLKTRGGIALSLLPAARVETFHERCAALEDEALAASSAGGRKERE